MSEHGTGPTDRLPLIDLETLDPERQAVLQEVMSGRGRLPTPFRIWIANPQLARRVHSLGQFLTDGAGLSLSKAESEIAVLTAARYWHAEYVLATHTREAQQAGLSDETIAAIKAGVEIPDGDPRQQAISRLMNALVSGPNPTDAVFDEALRLLGNEGIAEALMIVGYFTSVSLAMKTYGMTLPG